MKRIFLCLGLVVAISATAVRTGSACTCAAPASAAEGLDRSTAVFRGRVSEIRRPFWDWLGLTNSGRYRIRFTVVKQWKGAQSASIGVVTRLNGEACGFPFELNEEYLVYVVDEPKDLQTGICTGTKNITDAEPEMNRLDDIRARAPK
jgi:hypothetical protein